MKKGRMWLLPIPLTFFSSSEMSDQVDGDSGSLVPFTLFLGYPIRLALACQSSPGQATSIQAPAEFRDREENKPRMDFL